MNTPRAHRIREASVRAFLVLASLIFTLAVTEFGLRIGGFEYSPMKISVAGNSADWRYRHAYTDTHFVYDPRLIWRPRKAMPPFNADGFRGAILDDPVEPGTLRLFTLGDSNTLGWLGEDGGPAPAWPLFLEAYCNDGGQRLQVTNAGVYGYTTFQGARLLDELLPHNPDIVLVSFGCNDLQPAAISDAEFMEWTLGRRVSPYTTGIFRLRLAQLLVTAWDRRIGQQDTVQDGKFLSRVSLRDYRQNLARMARACAAQGTLCIFLTRPHTPPSEDPHVWSYQTPAFYRALMETAEAEGVPVIDVYAEFREAYDCFMDDSHFSVEGHQKAAQFISRELERILAEQGLTTPNQETPPTH